MILLGEKDATCPGVYRNQKILSKYKVLLNIFHIGCGKAVEKAQGGEDKPLSPFVLWHFACLTGALEIRKHFG
jgi:hypothetical protein